MTTRVIARNGLVAYVTSVVHVTIGCGSWYELHALA